MRTGGDCVDDDCNDDVCVDDCIDDNCIDEFTKDCLYFLLPLTSKKLFTSSRNRRSALNLSTTDALMHCASRCNRFMKSNGPLRE